MWKKSRRQHPGGNISYFLITNTTSKPDKSTTKYYSSSTDVGSESITGTNNSSYSGGILAMTMASKSALFIETTLRMSLYYHSRNVD